MQAIDDAMNENLISVIISIPNCTHYDFDVQPDTQSLINYFRAIYCVALGHLFCSAVIVFSIDKMHTDCVLKEK